MQQTPEIDQDILERLYAVIQAELGVDVRTLDWSKNFIFDLGLDSIQLATVALCIDQEFGINLPLTILDGASFSDFLRVFQGEVSAKKSS